jgi:8-oxo-dGTP diphosphatase
MFLFDCRKPIDAIPPEIDEGNFAFFTRDEINSLAIPPTDRILVWPVYDKHRHGFLAYRAECHPDRPVEMTVEEITPNSGAKG